MSTSSQRKAWNEAMRSAAGISATKLSRRSDRQRRQQKARKGFTEHGRVTSLEDVEYRAAVRIDHLEESKADEYDSQEEDEDASLAADQEYDEEEELEERNGRGKKRKKTKKRKPAMNKKSKLKASLVADQKRLKPRSLASILLEEATVVGGGEGTRLRDYVNAEAKPRFETYPARKFCPVTGQFGIYKDPKCGVHYATLKALEQIQERLPPWMSRGGSAAYSEAMKSFS